MVVGLLGTTKLVENDSNKLVDSTKLVELEGKKWYRFENFGKDVQLIYLLFH